MPRAVLERLGHHLRQRRHPIIQAPAVSDCRARCTSTTQSWNLTVRRPGKDLTVDRRSRMEHFVTPKLLKVPALETRIRPHPRRPDNASAPRQLTGANASSGCGELGVANSPSHHQPRGPLRVSLQSLVEVPRAVNSAGGGESLSGCGVASRSPSAAGHISRSAIMALARIRLQPDRKADRAARPASAWSS